MIIRDSSNCKKVFLVRETNLSRRMTLKKYEAALQCIFDKFFCYLEEKEKLTRSLNSSTTVSSESESDVYW